MLIDDFTEVKILSSNSLSSKYPLRPQIAFSLDSNQIREVRVISRSLRGRSLVVRPLNGDLDSSEHLLLSITNKLANTVIFARNAEDIS
ncbi:pol ii transcription elongation factor [Moniliophthora roreri]|nr:pol ii transcription elongation factor [Moniliophthora roreri]